MLQKTLESLAVEFRVSIPIWRRKQVLREWIAHKPSGWYVVKLCDSHRDYTFDTLVQIAWGHVAVYDFSCGLNSEFDSVAEVRWWSSVSIMHVQCYRRLVEYEERRAQYALFVALVNNPTDFVFIDLTTGQSEKRIILKHETLPHPLTGIYIEWFWLRHIPEFAIKTEL